MPHHNLNNRLLRFMNHLHEIYPGRERTHISLEYLSRIVGHEYDVSKAVANHNLVNGFAAFDSDGLVGRIGIYLYSLWLSGATNWSE